MNKTLTKNFDYSELPADTKGKLLKLAGYFKKAREKQALSIVEAGEFIANAHEELASAGREGKFSAWVEGECVCSRSAAYRYMGVFREFGNCPNVGQFDDSALYLLSADVAPKSAKKEALKLAAKGEYIAHKRAKELIEKHTVTVAPSANRQTDDPVTSTNGAAQAPSTTPKPEPASADLTCPNCGGEEFDEDDDGKFCVACKEEVSQQATECSHPSRLTCATCAEKYCPKCHPDHEADCEAQESETTEAEVRQFDKAECKKARNGLNVLIKALQNLGIYDAYKDTLLQIAKEVA